MNATSFAATEGEDAYDGDGKVGADNAVIVGADARYSTDMTRISGRAIGMKPVCKPPEVHA